MWGSWGRWEPGSLLLICLTTLLAWVQSHSFSFTWSANWKSVPTQPWSMLRSSCCWPWIFHSKYTLGSKNDWKKKKKKTTWEQCCQTLACKRSTWCTWWNRYSQASPKRFWFNKSEVSSENLQVHFWGKKSCISNNKVTLILLVCRLYFEWGISAFERVAIRRGRHYFPFNQVNNRC